MSDIFIKAFSFVVIIALGYILKRVGILNREDRASILNLVFYITLPGVIITSFRSFEYSHSLLIAILIGFLAPIAMLIAGYVVSRKSTIAFKRSAMIVPTGFGIGTFTIPFAATFLGPSSLIIIAMFDIGHASMSLGGTYATVASITASSEKITIKDFLKKLMSSVPFLAYIFMILINSVGITLPNGVFVFTELVGSATSFLVMIVIGLMLEVHIPKESIKEVLQLLAIRYGVVIAGILTIYFLLPLEAEYKLALSICLFAPPSASSVVFSQKLQCNPNVISAIQSIAIIISLLFSSLLIFWG